jgi:glycerophosphoryl diester phosphodiesterase
MLVIGHRGAAGLARENTLEALRAGFEADADMLEFDVRLTKDSILVVHHDFHTLRTYGKASLVSQHSLEELQKLDATQPITTLEEVLGEFLGKVLLNIELKSRGSGVAAANFLKKHYIKKQSDWDNVLFSSFSGSELVAARKVSKKANLALLHHENPFLFLAYHWRIQLTAVGFHRLYINPLALEIAKKAKLFTYAYTVNRPQTALLLAEEGLDGVVTDYPDRILAKVKKHSSRE